MIKFGKGVVKLRLPVLILSVLLLIPAGIGYFRTRVNYDILTYLPGDIETMRGQDILLEEFGTGAFSFCVVEGMEAKEVVARLRGIRCGFKSTSCPDQLASALEQAFSQEEQS